MSLARRNRRVGLAAGAFALGMIGLSFAAAPFYAWFCRVTGFDGTPRMAARAPEAASDRVVTVRFNADTAQGMPWRFTPVERAISVRLGEERIAVYRATNPTGSAVTGTATFNVLPEAAGPYFAKLACFCLEEQTLAPGQTVDMPVSFFVDPKILEDRDLAGIETVTLSYTFFRAEPKARLSELAPAGAARIN